MQFDRCLIAIAHVLRKSLSLSEHDQVKACISACLLRLEAKVPIKQGLNGEFATTWALRFVKRRSRSLSQVGQGCNIATMSINEQPSTSCF
jgi:hypothetical protein